MQQEDSAAKSGRQAKAEAIAAMKAKFATTIRKVFVNGLGREVGFREVTVLEQKQLSRIMIDNEQRKDIVYDAQCALINQVCLDKGFDIYACTEFDKIKLLMALYQTNMFKNEITFKCAQCGTDNKYRLDFQKVLERLDSFDLAERTFEFENASWKFSFGLAYPTVRRVSEFYRSYAQKYRGASKKETETLNGMINMDYVDTFVKSVRIEGKADGSVQDIDLSDFTAAEVEEIFSSFPQDVLYADDGVLSYIAKEYIQRINDSFEKRKCAVCGAEYEEAVDGDAQGFF